MKVFAILGLLFGSAVFARDGFDYITPEDLPLNQLEDVMTIGTRAALKLALEEGQINPAVFHIDRLQSIAKQEREDATSFEVIVEVSDKFNPSVNGVVETILDQDKETGDYSVKAHFVTMNDSRRDDAL